MLNIAANLSSYASDNRLDAEILLAHILNVNRAYLHTHPEQLLTTIQSDSFHQNMHKVLQGYPLAYLAGFKEFWSLDLQVTQDTLIPRVETELLVELALQKCKKSKSIIADLGTGSGAIALALASELSNADIYATDISHKALAVAKNNAQRLGFQNITFCVGTWCSALPQKKFDLIVSNPPYIANDDPHLSKNVRDHEPRLALFSEKNGLADSCDIIFHAKNYLKPEGYLMLEHGFQQAEQLRKIFSDHDYRDILTFVDLAGHERVTVGKRY